MIRLFPDGSRCYYNSEGKIHRDNDPAIISPSCKEWLQNGSYHRLDGPAIENIDGYKEYYINGKRHRTDGPAVVYPIGNKYWYYNDKLIPVDSQEEFEKYIKLIVFI